MPEDVEDINEQIKRLREELDRDTAGTFESGSSKTISIQDPGGSRIENLPVLPGYTVDQVIDIILPKWNLKRYDQRIYELAMVGSGKMINRPDHYSNYLKGDIYPAVQNGDKLQLIWIDID